MQVQKITLTSSTRQCNNPNAFLGYEGENEANKLVFEFTDGFRDGLGVLNLKRGDEIGYVSLTKVGTTYEFPVKNSILSKTGEIKFQVVITGNNGSVIKYDPFVMTVKDAIDAESEMPEDYPDWVDMANAKLAEVDKAIANAEEVSKQLLEDKENGVFNGKDGIDGKSGVDGKNGVSPTVATEQTATGAKITITDANGTHTAEVFNGKDGKDGKDGTMTFEELTEEQKATLKGADGFSPIANVTQIDDGAIISVTDEKGTSTATVRNGKDGADGEDGLTPHIGANGNWWIGDTDTGKPASGSGGGLVELPVATADTLGGIKVGEGLEITEDGVLNALGGGSSSSGDAAPVGSIISFMGTTAPENYLVCDGAELNIADYKKLADHFETQFGAKNHFGGDGVTTFAVPDLRNEFLRGYGDLSNDVGIHQDGTAFPNMYIANNGKGMLVPKYNVSSGGRHESINRDSEILESDVGSDSSKYQLSSFTGTLASNATYDTLCELYTSRPTNVAVLYCIKYTTAGFEAGEPPISTTDKLGGENYSTEEQRIGTWIDGKPLYQKTITGYKTPTTTDGTSSRTTIDVAELYIDTAVELKGLMVTTTNGFYSMPAFYGGKYYGVQTYFTKDAGTIIVNNSCKAYGDLDCYITIKYTKTTD